MIDHDNLEDFRDGETYDLTDAGYADDRPLIEQWARTLSRSPIFTPTRSTKPSTMMRSMAAVCTTVKTATARSLGSASLPHLPQYDSLYHSCITCFWGSRPRSGTL